MRRNYYKLNSLRHRFSEELFSQTIVHCFGTLSDKNTGKKIETNINCVFANLEQQSNKPFFIDSIPIEALSILRRGDVYNQEGIYLKKEPSRTEEKRIRFQYSHQNKPEPITNFLSTPTLDKKYKQLSLEFRNQWAIKVLEQDQAHATTPIIIPCSAIASFYLPHSCLIRAALSGEGKTADTTLVNQKLTEEGRKVTIREGIEYVHLTKSMYDVVAPHIARIYLSTSAKRAFNAIHGMSKLIPLHTTNNFALSCMPFVEGTLNWKVLGKAFTDPEFGPLFLVSQIISCNGSFPFKELIFGRENDTRGIEDKNTKEVERGDKKPPVKLSNPPPKNNDDTQPKEPTSEPETDLDHNKIADSEIESTHIIFDNDDTLYSQLSNTIIRKIDKITIKTKGKQPIIKTVSAAGVSFLAGPKGDTSGQTESIRSKLEAGRISTVNSKLIHDTPNSEAGISAPDLARIYDLLSDLHLTGFKVTFRNIKSPCENALQLTRVENVIPPEYRDLSGPGSWIMRHKPPKDSGHEKLEETIHRCRKFLIAEFAYDDSFYAYLVEFQDAEADSIASLFFSNFDRRMSPKALLNEILLNVMGKRRHWRKNTKLKYAKKLTHKVAPNHLTQAEKQTVEQAYLDKVSANVVSAFSLHNKTQEIASNNEAVEVSNSKEKQLETTL
ncbi:hypothetical protein L1077_16550 [Pseudoalteromonas luteoviolacea]|uniref:hypothetical protein n=1 Tax=Pseudoalteromonas luteoviolacea TaxID=43657 RepID=UPI001F27D877|nr:hypothetical protein [Pseudoalteromonas luteoviolacea]MCF6441048.1 hypothetical protein [Pseudoalteromonas luteoviolacea]